MESLCKLHIPREHIEVNQIIEYSGDLWNFNLQHQGPNGSDIKPFEGHASIQIIFLTYIQITALPSFAKFTAGDYLYN